MESEPNSFLSNLWVITIGSGLAVAFIIWTVKRFSGSKKNKNVGEVPVLQSSQELSLAKNWKTTFRENEKDYHENVEIYQVGNKVSGTINLMDIDNPGDITDSYEFEGVFKNRVLTGIFEPKDATDYERGAFVLETSR